MKFTVFLFISYCWNEEKMSTPRKEGKILMIYVNHDTKNAEAKNILHSRNLLLFFIQKLMFKEVARYVAPGRQTGMM